MWTTNMDEENIYKQILQRIPVAENAKWDEYNDSESLEVTVHSPFVKIVLKWGNTEGMSRRI
jgi:hypothetical protein